MYSTLLTRVFPQNLHDGTKLFHTNSGDFTAAPQNTSYPKGPWIISHVDGDKPSRDLFALEERRFKRLAPPPEASTVPGVSRFSTAYLDPDRRVHMIPDDMLELEPGSYIVINKGSGDAALTQAFAVYFNKTEKEVFCYENRPAILGEENTVHISATTISVNNHVYVQISSGWLIFAPNKDDSSISLLIRKDPYRKNDNEEKSREPELGSKGPSSTEDKIIRYAGRYPLSRITNQIFSLKLEDQYIRFQVIDGGFYFVTI